MSKGLKIAEPPQRRQHERQEGQGDRPQPTTREKFDQVAPSQKVQFNKRVTREVADGYEILAIRTRRKVPDLLAEALQVLEERYGRG